MVQQSRIVPAFVTQQMVFPDWKVSFLFTFTHPGHFKLVRRPDQIHILRFGTHFDDLTIGLFTLIFQRLDLRCVLGQPRLRQSIGLAIEVILHLHHQPHASNGNTSLHDCFQIFLCILFSIRNLIGQIFDIGT